MGYSYKNKLLARWFSPKTKEEEKSKKKEKINIGWTKEDSITNLNAQPVFLLFKQALSTGWDCPRAKILVKLRENMNETFEIQTLGRLRRMPKARHYGMDILDCSYLYTFDEKYKLEVLKTANGFERQRLFLKEDAKKIKLVKEVRNLDINYVDETAIRKSVYECFKNKYKMLSKEKENITILENNGFKFLGTSILKKYLTGKYITFSELEKNTTNYNEMMIEVNTHAHGIELRHHTDIIKKYLGLSYDKTIKVLKTLFWINYGKSSYKLLNLPMKEFYAFIINNHEQLKRDFIEFSGKSAKQFLLNDDKDKKLENFTIPAEEYYRYDPFERQKEEIKSNVYKNYNESMITDELRSKSERLFERYCEQNENVKFVYKNGDSGRQYLSILYVSQFTRKLFYPDYVVQLKNGTMWIIETKGGESQGESNNIDIQVENKFEALKQFATTHNYNFGFVRDKNEALYLNNKEYVDDLNDNRWQALKEIF